MENQPGETPVSATSLQSDSQTPKPNRKWIMGMALVVLLFVAGGSAFALTRKDSTKDSNHSETAGIDPAVEREGNKNDNGQQGSSTTSGQPSFADQYSSICKNESVSFTSAPLPESQLGYIEPMGKMLDGHVTPTDHVYVHPINSRAADNTYDVVMPANGTIVGISAMPAQYIGDKLLNLYPRP
ncbi:MAG: hypothetical protein K0S20_811 [Patescibacteria group bacterium]|nr:hypothetical protein [Patescibacteria group bacterium]